MRTLMKEEEKRQREHDAAIEVLRRRESSAQIVFFSHAMISKVSRCQIIMINSFATQAKG
jgi:hypothetical protein